MISNYSCYFHFSQRVTRSRTNVQHGWWFFGGSSFEVHPSVHKIFYDGWDPAKKKLASGTGMKKMDKAVHNYIKTHIKQIVTPHLQVVDIISIVS